MTWRASAATTLLAVIVWIAVWILVDGPGGGGPAAGGETAAPTFRLGIDPASVESLHLSRRRKGEGGGPPVRVERGDGGFGSGWMVEVGSGEGRVPARWPSDDNAVLATVRALAGARLSEREGGAEPSELGAVGSDWTLRIVEAGSRETVIESVGPGLARRVPVRVTLGGGDARDAWVPLELARLAGVGTEEGSAGAGAVPWLSRRLLDGGTGAPVTRVEVEPLGEGGESLAPLVMRRAGRAWRLEAPALDVRLDPERVRGLIDELQSIVAMDVMPAAEGQTPAEEIDGIARFAVTESDGRAPVRRSVVIGGRGNVAGSLVRGVAVIEPGAGDGERGPAYSARVEIERGELPSPPTDVAAYADRRIVPWESGETWSIEVAGAAYEQGIDGWRRASGAPLTRGESLGVAAALDLLGSPRGMTLEIGPGEPPAGANEFAVERLGGTDAVRGWALAINGGLSVQVGDARWSWQAAPREAGWLLGELARDPNAGGG